MYTIILHMNNAEPVKVEVDEMPSPTDTCILCKNPRERSDRELNWLDDGVTTVIFPMWRINFIQVLPGSEAQVEFPLPFRND